MVCYSEIRSARASARLDLASESSQFISRPALYSTVLRRERASERRMYGCTRRTLGRRRREQLTNYRTRATHAHVTRADNNYTRSNRGDEAHRNF